MQCEFCGEEVSQGALACPRCGSPISPAQKEKPATPPPGRDSPRPPSGVTQQPPTKVPQPPPAKPAPADASWSLPDEPNLESAAAVPPWELQVPSSDQPRLSHRTQPEQVSGGGPPQAPLKKPEEESIAPVDEKDRIEDVNGQPTDFTLGVSGTDGSSPPRAATIEPSAASGPDAALEQAAGGDDLTGGYKDGAFAGASVAGAGVQTADDPFGLDVTEDAPGAAVEQEAARKFDWGRWYNILMIIVALLVTCTVAATGIYYGFLRKKTAPTTDPVATVNEYCELVISGDISRLGDVSVPGSSYSEELSGIIEPYEKIGVLSMKQFEGTATEVGADSATVEIKKFVIRSANPDGEVEYLNLLSINEPAPLRTTVSLVKQNGKWRVSD